MNPSVHIASLLRSHDCVILPGFGGFVASFQPARINATQHVIHPPDRYIAFNSSLVNNDGLLVNQVAMAEGIDFKSAEKQVATFVSECRSALEKKEVVIIPGVGKMFTDENRQTRFVKDITVNHLADSFGLVPVKAVPYVAEKPVKIMQNASAAVNGSSLKPARLLQINAYHIIIALLSFGLVLQWNIYDMDISKLRKVGFEYSNVLDYLKGMFNTKAPSADSYSKVGIPQEPAAKKSTGTESPVSGYGITETKSASSPAESQANRETTAFRIVIGSFRSEENARKLLHAVADIENAAVIIAEGEKIRVAVGFFQSREQAVNSLPTYRESYPGAWIVLNHARHE